MKVSTRSYIRSLSILHFALISGQVIFALVTLFLRTSDAIELVPFSPEISKSLLYIVPVVAAGAVLAGGFLFRQKVAHLKMLPASAEKYGGYRSACILRYAITEAPSLVTIVLFLLSGNYYYLAITGAVIIALISLRPSSAALIRHLQPSFEEQAALEQPDGVLYEEDFVRG